MKISICPADTIFSIYIRLRDKRCMRCGRQGTPDRFGRPVKGLQNSHFFGRGNETTRFDEDNCDALCCGCHVIWGSEDYESYRNFKIKQLGEDGFQNLLIRKNLTGKKDRKLAEIYWTVRVKEDFGDKNIGG